MKKADKKNLEDIRLAARKEVEAIIENARACLSSPQFQRYSRKLKKAREKLLLQLTEYRHPDPVRYAFGISEILTMLRTAEALHKDVDKDIRKGGKRNK